MGVANSERVPSGRRQGFLNDQVWPAAGVGQVSGLCPQSTRSGGRATAAAVIGFHPLREFERGRQALPRSTERHGPAPGVGPVRTSYSGNYNAPPMRGFSPPPTPLCAKQESQQISVVTGGKADVSRVCSVLDYSFS